MFTVTMTLDGDTIRCVPLKQELDDWIHGYTGDLSLLPAVKLLRGEPQAAVVLRLTWIAIAATSPLEAMTRAAAILAQGCPRFAAVEPGLRVTADVHDPRVDLRRPHDE